MKHQRETPDFVISKLIWNASVQDGHSILEPSCGEGKIIKYLLENYAYSDLDINMIELNKEKSQKSKELSHLAKTRNSRGFDVYHTDFLEWSKINYDSKFDAILACPPFKDSQDLNHIQAMYSLLKRKGTLSSLTKPTWIINNEEKDISFRKWLNDKDYHFELLPDNTFMEKGKTVPTAILTIINY